MWWKAPAVDIESSFVLYLLHNVLAVMIFVYAGPVLRYTHDTFLMCPNKKIPLKQLIQKKILEGLSKGIVVLHLIPDFLGCKVINFDLIKSQRCSQKQARNK